MKRESQWLVAALAGVIAIELFAGVVEWLVMPASTCRNSLGTSAIAVFSFGLVMFAFTFAGTFWRRFVERRIERHGQRRVEALRTTAPSAAARSDGLVGRFSVFNRLTGSIWNHPWLTALIAAGLFIVLFGAFVLIGAALEPNSCGS